jgi:hypothetical protein
MSCNQRLFTMPDFADDLGSEGGPHKGTGMRVVFGHIVPDGPLQLWHAAEAAPPDALAGQLGKEALHLVERAGPLGVEWKW